MKFTGGEETDSRAAELHSSFDSNSRKDSGKPKIPKINIGAIRKNSTEKVSDKVKGATSMKPKIPNLKGKINLLKSNELDSEIKNLKLEAPKNFQQEFLENID